MKISNLFRVRPRSKPVAARQPAPAQSSGPSADAKRYKATDRKSGADHTFLMDGHDVYQEAQDPKTYKVALKKVSVGVGTFSTPDKQTYSGQAAHAKFLEHQGYANIREEDKGKAPRNGFTNLHKGESVAEMHGGWKGKSYRHVTPLSDSEHQRVEQENRLTGMKDMDATMRSVSRRIMSSVTPKSKMLQTSPASIATLQGMKARAYAKSAPATVVPKNIVTVPQSDPAPVPQNQTPKVSRKKRAPSVDPIAVDAQQATSRPAAEQLPTPGELDAAKNANPIAGAFRKKRVIPYNISRNSVEGVAEKPNDHAVSWSQMSPSAARMTAPKDSAPRKVVDPAAVEIPKTTVKKKTKKSRQNLLSNLLP